MNAVAGLANAPADVAALRARFRDGKAAVARSLPLGAGHRHGGVQPGARAGQTCGRHARRAVAGRRLPAGAALVAVGGYGRGELFPYSDVDVLLLLPDGMSPPDESLRACRWVRFVTACWDIGLEIGSSVRTVEECLAEAARDVTVQTALLEARPICGAQRLFKRFVQAHTAALDPKAFLRAKMLEMQQRHVKYEGTPYALEPNCKESPGGLRDLQVVVWVARAAGLGRTWGAAGGQGADHALRGQPADANTRPR